jgi:peptidoglycan/xylan/chitin deacetylase (PgdA/CDA1 family)
LETIILCEEVEGTTAQSWSSSGHAVPGTPPQVEKLQIRSTERVEIELRALNPSLGIVIGDVHVPPLLLGLPSLGSIRLQQGLLRSTPREKHSFAFAANGSGLVGSIVFRVNGDAAADSDDIISSATAPITRADSAADVEARAEELGQLLLRRVLENLDAGSILCRRQPAWKTNARLIPTKASRFGVRIGSALRQVGRSSHPKLLVKSIFAMAILALVAPARNFVRTLRRRHPVRVFTFHRVSSLCRDGMTVAPEVFKRQLRYIARTHRVVSLGTCLEMARTSARLARPVAAITFDDGYRSVYTNALPIMRHEGFSGACFVSTELVGTSHRFAHDASLPVVDLLEIMNWRELEALRAEGWDICGHTATHARLSECDDETLNEELVRPLGVLQERLGIERPALAYPFGGREDITIGAVNVARCAGYSACLSDFGGENHPPFDAFGTKRIELGGDHPTLAWKTRVHGLDVGGLRRPAPRRGRIARAWYGPARANA